MGPSLQLSTCVLFLGFLGLCKTARDPYATCQISSWSDNRRRSYGDYSPTTQSAAETLNSDPLTLKLVHGVLVSQGPFLPSLVFVGLFVFPLGGGTGQTDRQTDEQDQHMMGPPSRKDGSIIIIYMQTHRHTYLIAIFPVSLSCLLGVQKGILQKPLFTQKSMINGLKQGWIKNDRRNEKCALCMCIFRQAKTGKWLVETNY